MKIGNRSYPAARRLLIQAVMYSGVERKTIRKALAKLEQKFGKAKVADLRALVL
jgi:hypothetical protein